MLLVVILGTVLVFVVKSSNILYTPSAAAGYFLSILTDLLSVTKTLGGQCSMIMMLLLGLIADSVVLLV